MMAQKLEEDSNNCTAGPLIGSSSSYLPKSNINVAGILKVEKVGPVFRIVNPIDTKKEVKPLCGEKRTSVKEDAEALETKRRRGDLYADDIGPFWHKISNPMITPPIITENLPLKFKDLPMTGGPKCSESLENYENEALRQFVGCDLDETEYEELENYCNPDNLKTGKEIKMSTRVPVPGLIAKSIVCDVTQSDEDLNSKPPIELCTLKRLKQRMQRDELNTFPRCLKYRGIKLMPLSDQQCNTPEMDMEPNDLEPGKDLIFRIRLYRPFNFTLTGEKHVRGRHSVFNCDVVMCGRQTLADLRDRFMCRNDLDMRLDMSDRPDEQPIASAKKVFPSGFLFINNVFYVDGRSGRRDTSAGVRRWARARGLGDFPARRMETCRLDRVLVKLAHPEVYVHQGGCEHVFLVSEVRLASRADPLRAAAYPRHSAISQNQTIYCTTCAEFGARWLVTCCQRVPFDPAFFCEVCFKQYLYRDGRKIGHFKAYAYRGNELNLVGAGEFEWRKQPAERN